MAKEIRWTPEALARFEIVIDYLEANWTEREVINFVSSTDKVIQLISENPKIFRKLKLNIYEAIVTPHNILIYKVFPKRIEILTFWDTRQNPRKKKL